VDNERKLFSLHEIFVSILKKLLVMFKAEIANLDKKELKQNSNKKYFLAKLRLRLCCCKAIAWRLFCLLAQFLH
jgi:hypothetical protein